MGLRDLGPTGINKNSPARAYISFIAPRIIHDHRATSRRFRIETTDMTARAAAVLIHYDAGVSRRAWKCGDPLYGSPQIVSVEHTRKTEVCGLSRATTTSVYAIS